MLTEEGMPYFGYNSAITPALQASEQALRKSWFDKTDWSPKSYSNWSHAQVLLHGEAHSMMKALQANAKLPKEVIVFVDRKTCGLCEHQLPPVLKAMGVEKVYLIQWKDKNGLILELLPLNAKK